MMEKSRSYLNPKCRARANENGEWSVVARKPIHKGELISIWGGSILPREALDPSMPRFNQRVLQIDEDLFLLTAERPEPNDCFNHSCDPNLGLSGQIVLISMREIRAGEELTFDYAMTDGEPYDEFECHCGTRQCRRLVTGNDWKRPELWSRYDGYFSPYLAKRIAALRNS
jgi:SET domain-containing protein